jgi:hypothetical protein
VRVSIVPHRTQAWVTSLRSSDSVPLAIRARVIAVITIWCPQCVQGRRKVGRLEGATSSHCMELFQFTRRPFHSGPFPARFKRVSTSFCASHIICASRHPSASQVSPVAIRPSRRSDRTKPREAIEFWLAVAIWRSPNRRLHRCPNIGPVLRHQGTFRPEQRRRIARLFLGSLLAAHWQPLPIEAQMFPRLPVSRSRTSRSAEHRGAKSTSTAQTIG